MGTEGHAGLIGAIQRFLDDATGMPQQIFETWTTDLERGRGERPPPSLET
jgi:hypothetical protein